MTTQIFLRHKIAKIRLFIFIYQILLALVPISCDGCKNIVNLSTKSCYNDVIKFDHDKWRAGHACVTDNGDLIMEFSLNPEESSKRLFYGLNKNGRYYFPGEPVYKQIDNMVCQDCASDPNHKGRFESINLLVYLNGDTTRQKPYLFSMSSFHSLAELIDITDSDNFKYYAWNSLKFFDLNRPIFSFQYSLYEIGNSRYYIAAFIESGGVNNNEEEYSNTVTLMKFHFNNFASSNYRVIDKNITLSNTFDGRVVSAFRLEDSKLIVLLLVPSSTAYKAYFYDENDSTLTKKGECSIYDGVSNLWVGYGIFIKGISVKGDYAAFAFFSDGNNGKSLSFKFVKYKGSYTFDYYYMINFDGDDFRRDISSNGLYKLEDNRVVLFTTKDYNSISYGGMYMFLFDFYNDYQKMRMRKYIFHYPNKRFAKEVSAYMYNGYILFSATLGESNEDPQNIFAIMMIFGFANGTDHTIDISPYLMDTGYYDGESNLYNYLMSNMSIDNNIFGYKKVEKIRLISICDELKLYKGKYGVSQESSVLPLGETFDSNIVLLQNKEKKKQEDKLYMLEYQFMVEEPDHDTLYSMANSYTENSRAGTTQSFNTKNYYTAKTLNGRVNRLYFKLCHRYCIECMEFGNNDNDQRCESCKTQYTYDYLTYVNRFTKNCVPYDYLYDVEEQQLKLCNTANYKYYYNLTRNRERYCFKYDYTCPDVYYYLNETSHECLVYDPPAPTTVVTTIVTERPTTIVTEKPTEKPTTIITEKPTTIVTEKPTEKPTTIITEKPTTIITEKPTEKPTTIITEKPTTIITEKPTTIVTEKPTTIVTEKPTTIVTEKPTTIVTERPTTIVTEKPTTIVTEKPTTIITEKPTTILTEKPTIIVTEKSEEYSSSILEDVCKNASKLDETCRNLTNQEIYNGILEEVLSNFPPNGGSVIHDGKDGYKFQVTTPQNEKDSLNNTEDPIILDISDCEEKLKEANGITGNRSLIVYKFYKDASIPRNKELQYEIYDPYTYKRLNLSVCNTINVYIRTNISENESIYQNILDQGYDPFDLRDKFYREICTQYDSENGTDVLLDAREEYYYSPIVNETACQDNCHYSSYSLNTKYLMCECDVDYSGIVTLDIKHLDKNNVANSFYSSLKLSNYKVVICYNLVFNFKIFCQNYGSIISLVLLGLYIATIILYCFRTTNPLKVEISKFLFAGEEINNNILPMDEPKSHSKRRSSKKKKTNKALPPKRLTSNIYNTDKSKVTSTTQSKHSKKDKSKDINIKNKTNDIEIHKSHKSSSKILFKKQEKSSLTVFSKNKLFEAKEKLDEKDKEEENEIIHPELLDNYEFNNLEYEQACEYDKRSFCRTYYSVLKREELVFFTFLSCNDYNLLYVKIARFLVLACTNMTMTALFFVHKTMYKKQDIEENWSFVQKLPQLLFVLIANHIIEVYLCYLSMTDSAYYEIKELSKKPDNSKKIINIIDCMKTKLIIFFISTFILFLAYWYFISAFCAVYKNTQYIFVRDSSISFATSLLDPFVTYGLTMILRKISLSICCRKKAGCLYKLSDIIPIF